MTKIHLLLIHNILEIIIVNLCIRMAYYNFFIA